jgi:predicted branched-subunit amino acid permease
MGPAIPAEWGVEFAAPVLFVSLMMASSDRRDKLAAAALAMGLTYLLASLPNRTGILIAVISSVVIMLLLQRHRQS